MVVAPSFGQFNRIVSGCQSRLVGAGRGFVGRCDRCCVVAPHPSFVGGRGRGRAG
jgi:hypothetical protein